VKKKNGIVGALYKNNIKQMLKTTFKYEEVTAKLFSEIKKVTLAVFSCSELTYSS